MDLSKQIIETLAKYEILVQLTNEYKLIEDGNDLIITNLIELDAEKEKHFKKRSRKKASMVRELFDMNL